MKEVHNMNTERRPFSVGEYEYYMNLSERTIQRMSDNEFIRFQLRRQRLIQYARRIGKEYSYATRRI